MFDLPTAETIPPCWNRVPRVAGEWVQTGKTRSRMITHAPGRGGVLTHRPVLRWHWSPFVDRCAAHDGQGIGPNGENYPEAHGWMSWCRMCRWMPNQGANP